jgi:hypothetical protein
MSYPKLEKRLERLDERLDTIAVTLARNTSSLEEHIRRTEILEQDFKPVKSHVTLMNNAAKVSSALLAAILAAKSLGLF